MSETLSAPTAGGTRPADTGDPHPADPAPEATFVSHLGDPFALGLASFGVSALVLSTVMSGLIPATSTPAVLSSPWRSGSSPS